MFEANFFGKFATPMRQLDCQVLSQTRKLGKAILLKRQIVGMTHDVSKSFELTHVRELVFGDKGRAYFIQVQGHALEQFFVIVAPLFKVVFELFANALQKTFERGVETSQLVGGGFEMAGEFLLNSLNCFLSGILHDRAVDLHFLKQNR